MTHRDAGLWLPHLRSNVAGATRELSPRNFAISLQLGRSTKPPQASYVNLRSGIFALSTHHFGVKLLRSYARCESTDAKQVAVTLYPPNAYRSLLCALELRVTSLAVPLLQPLGTVVAGRQWTNGGWVSTRGASLWT